MTQTAAEILYNARWMAGLSQAQVAHRAGVSQQMIGQYERGLRQPSFATLSALVAGCGVDLTAHLVPRPGYQDEPTRALLDRPPLDRLQPQARQPLLRFAAVSEDLPFLVAGKAAARIHGAFIQVHQLELWFSDDVDLVRLKKALVDAGVVDSGGMGTVVAPEPYRILLVEGWTLMMPSVGINLHLRSVPEFPEMAARATTLAASDRDTPLLVASAYDAIVWWHGRDLDHLEMQRALRVAADKQNGVRIL
jgi:transcriptional regulator with XRE-family HTH domain